MFKALLGRNRQGMSMASGGNGIKLNSFNIPEGGAAKQPEKAAPKPMLGTTRLVVARNFFNQIPDLETEIQSTPSYWKKRLETAILEKRQRACWVMLDAVWNLLNEGNEGMALVAIEELKSRMGRKDYNAVLDDGSSVQAAVLKIVSWEMDGGMVKKETLKQIAEVKWIAYGFLTRESDKGEALIKLQKEYGDILPSEGLI